MTQVALYNYRQQAHDKVWREAISASEDIQKTFALKFNDAFKSQALLGYLIEINGKVRPKELEALMIGLYKDSAYIRNIAIAPNNELRYIYPLIGSEKALGLRYEKTPTQWPMVQHTIQERVPHLAGPLQLVEGMSGLLYFVPVFLEDGSYWGMITTVIDTHGFLSFIQKEYPSLQVALRVNEEIGVRANKQLFYGNENLFNAEGVRVNIPIPGGSWEAIIQPAVINRTLFWIYNLAALLLSGLITILFFIALNETRKRIKNDAQVIKCSSRLPGFIYTFRLYADGHSCFPYASAGIQDIYRVNAADVRTDASKIFTLIHPDDLAGVVASIQESAKNFNPWQYEYRVIFENGQTHWLYGNAIPEPNKEADASQIWHGFITDISVRKQLEENYFISVSMKNAIIETSPQAIINLDSTGLIKAYNPQFLNMFGYPTETIDRLIKLDEITINQLLPLRLREDDRLILSRYMDNTVDSLLNHSFELIGLRLDNQEFPIEITISPIRILNKNLFSVIIRNLTEIKQAEAALKQGLREAEQANTVKSQFLAMMSHEIRTPLHAILGMQELLTHTPLDSTQAGYLQMATLAGNNLLTLINDILDLTKVEANKLDLEEIPFNVIELTQLCVQLLTVTAEAKGLTLITHIDPELTPWISGDPLRFRQVLLNLLSNAIKFIEQGSVTVKLSPYASTDSACVLMVEVIDTGIGIPEDLHASLFDIFVQADPSDTRKYGGSGLGLPISRRLVALWKGDIGVDSTPLVGSRFWFTVGALATAPTPTLATILKQDDSTIPNTFIARILLVEDSLINQAVMTAMLHSAGHKVDLADCGTKGIEAASENVYDIILMDVSMPDMSGMEATTKIRQLNGPNALVPIIAVTAHALAGYKEMCLAAGMNGYATKPINQRQLQTLLATWCAKTETQVTERSNTLVEDSPALAIAEPAIHIDETILAELTTNLGEKQVKELLQIYVTQLNAHCENIKKGIIQNDLSLISREGHTIKSSSATFGMASLQAAGKDLEACGYRDDLSNALIIAEHLLRCAEVTMQMIKLRIE